MKEGHIFSLFLSPKSTPSLIQPLVSSDFGFHTRVVGMDGLE